MENNFDISNRIYKLLAMLIAGLLVFLAVTLIFNFQNSATNYPREITVSATGKTTVIPDVATIILGVTTEGDKAAKVIKENTEKMNAIIKELKNLGIEEKDIKTTAYNLSPRYDWNKGERKFAGYDLNQEITVKIRDFEKIGNVLEKATSSGANIVQDLQFTIDDIDKAKEEAIKEAISKAKLKAKQLARTSGLKLGKLINVYEEYSPEGAPSYALQTKEGMGAGGGETTPPEIQPGQQEVAVTMNLTYRVR